MSPAAQNQINFPCRKLSVRRKMDFDHDLASPTKSPRKETSDIVTETEQSVRLTRSSSRRAQTPIPSIPHAVRSSPRKVHRNLFKNTDDSSPAKGAPLNLMTKIYSPKKTAVRGNEENHEGGAIEKKSSKSTMLSSPVKLKLHHPNVTSFAKARQALHTTTPSTIFCRDKELAVIENFMRPLIDERKPGSMYISGRPGTGKTACVTHILSNTIFSGKFKSIFVNCMLLQTPASIFQHIAQQLDPKWNASAKEALPFLEDRLTDTGPMIVLVLDEIDQMSTRDQSVLYSIFELPALKNSRLILIGLANALDLTDRALVRLQSRVNFKPVLLNFSPYSKQDIATILSQRIQEAVTEDVGNVIAPSALQYLGGKISSTSGDLRKAIDICRRAVELAETTAKKQLVLAPSNTESQNGGSVPANKCVNIPLLCKMMASVESSAFCSANSDDMDDTPLQQKLIIVTLLVLVKLGKSKQVTLGKLHQSYSKVCSKYGVTAIDFDEFAHTCSLVESRGIVTLKKKGNTRLAPICLRLDEREVESTLKDKTLLSSILAQGSLFV
ncbi:cell division control protein 6 homolog [Daphnia carinata]|uniref:cell division control protein 6 homolog n=1 Tax=Daphnia carinata TaxID=120202 RepID=UPI00257B4FFA|nr:cell division control protein 6 homolog [Daphnia carinata]